MVFKLFLFQGRQCVVSQSRPHATFSTSKFTKLFLSLSVIKSEKLDTVRHGRDHLDQSKHEKMQAERGLEWDYVRNVV